MLCTRFVSSCWLGALILVAAAAATARTIDLTPEWKATNHQRIFLAGGGDLLWINADDPTNLGPSSQQWQWLDFSSTLDRISPNERVLSATLSWFGNVENDQSDGTTVWSVFPVPDDGAKGRVAILEDGVYDPSDIVRYYATWANLAMGKVTTRQIAASTPDTPVSWDVTPLVQTWHRGAVRNTAGQMMILNDRNGLFGREDVGLAAGEDWINWGQVTGFFSGTGPTLVAEVDSRADPPGRPQDTEHPLRAGDADQDFDFDQLDLVRVQVAAKYLTGRTATWGEGDWNGAPGGRPGEPPPGDGLFDQRDIVAALSAGIYLTGHYASLQQHEIPSSQLDANHVTPVPEPAGWCLAGIALACLAIGSATTRKRLLWQSCSARMWQ